MLKRLAEARALDSDVVVENGASEIVISRSKTGRLQTTAASPTGVRSGAETDSSHVAKTIRTIVAIRDGMSPEFTPVDREVLQLLRRSPTLGRRMLDFPVSIVTAGWPCL